MVLNMLHKVKYLNVVKIVGFIKLYKNLTIYNQIHSPQPLLKNKKPTTLRLSLFLIK